MDTQSSFHAAQAGWYQLRQSLAVRYGLAVGSVVLATGLARGLGPYIEHNYPLEPLFLAVLLTAWFGGLVPALLATVLGGLAADFFLLPPVGQFTPEHLHDWYRLSLYFVTSTAVSWLGGSLYERGRAAEATLATHRSRATKLGSLVNEQAVEITQAFHSLKRTEAQLRLFVNYAPAAIAMFDRSMVYIVTSRRWLEDYGLLGRELEGKSHYEVFPEIPERWKEIHRRALAGSTERAEEDRFDRQDGSVQWLRWEVRPWHAGDGSVGGIVVFSEDITARKTVEEALRASEEKFRLLVNSINDHAVYILDPEGGIGNWNEEAAKITGFAAHEVVGRDDSRFFTEADRALELPRLELADATTRGSAEISGWRVRKDGSQYWADGSVSAIRVNGELRGFTKILRDRTAQTQSQRLLKAVMDHSFDAIISIDQRGIVRSVNRMGEKLFGYRASELLGQNVSLLMAEPHRSRHDDYLAAYVNGGPPKIIGIGWEVEGLRKDGSTFPVDLAVTEFEWEGQRHFTGILRDLSDKKKIEEQLRQSQKMESVGRLAGGVAHDFNNILTVILSYSGELRRRFADDESVSYEMNQIHQAGQRAAALTRQLLAFSRRQILQLKPLNLSDVVSKMETFVRRLIGEDIQLDFRLRPDLPAVMADVGQLEQILMNLAVNSRDAMPEGGRLCVETGMARIDETFARKQEDLPAGHFALLSVTDSGIGMDEATRQRIFEPFFTTKGIGKGTGLGLATVYGVVKQLGGHVSVYSEPGMGTAFRLYFPLAPGQQNAADDSALPLDSVRATGETVLLVEDDAAVRGAITRTLEDAGYGVIGFGNGQEAAEYLGGQHAPFGVLLTDVVMPGMGGVGLADKNAEHHPEIPIVFMSGYTEHAISSRITSRPGALFLQKPFDRLTLLRTLRQALHTRPNAPPALRAVGH